MYINFDSIRNQDLDLATIVELLKVLYTQVNDSVFQNIVLNEFVDDVKQDTDHADEFTFTLSKKPITISDILIVSEDGTLVVTPKYIIKIDGNSFIVKGGRVKTGMKFYVSYKY